MKLEDVYFILTADHSTPISVMDHTGDPVPLVIKGPEVRVDDVEEFNERSVTRGGLCRIRGNNIMYRVKPVFSITKLSQIAARATLKDEEYIRESTKLSIASREYLYQEISKFKTLRVFPSKSNYMK